MESLRQVPESGSGGMTRDVVRTFWKRVVTEKTGLSILSLAPVPLQLSALAFFFFLVGNWQSVSVSEMAPSC